MKSIEYYVGNKLVVIKLEKLDAISKSHGGSFRSIAKFSNHQSQPKLLQKCQPLSSMRSELIRSRFVGDIVPGMTVGGVASKDSGTLMIPTATLIVEGASKAARRGLLSSGLELLEEGEEGKLLLRSPDPGIAGISSIAAQAKKCVESGNVKAAQPNFLRIAKRVKPSVPGGKPLWHHNNDGGPGIAGADVAAHAAWTITKGEPSIRIAVLDEGVDSSHPALKKSVVDQKDFVDGHSTASPDGDDAHGTACAGIIGSRSTKWPGLAPQTSLIGVRIAKGDGADGWIFDDYQTADAIDWSWKIAGADVLSNSWGGGAPSDIISAAFQRAQSKGRKGKGCVVVAASGNENLSSVSYPAALPFVLSVGASTPFDQRQSPHAKGGESWWGSNYGKGLSLVAPGVCIVTTDIRGKKGYSQEDFTMVFNGTSSATPMVAAAAGMILSVRPELTEARVREIIMQTADRLAPGGKRDNNVGWGRLNIFSALRVARR